MHMCRSAGQMFQGPNNYLHADPQPRAHKWYVELFFNVLFVCRFLTVGQLQISHIYHHLYTRHSLSFHGDVCFRGILPLDNTLFTVCNRQCAILRSVCGVSRLSDAITMSSAHVGAMHEVSPMWDPMPDVLSRASRSLPQLERPMPNIPLCRTPCALQWSLNMPHLFVLDAGNEYNFFFYGSSLRCPLRCLVRPH